MKIKNNTTCHSVYAYHPTDGRSVIVSLSGICTRNLFTSFRQIWLRVKARRTCSMVAYNQKTKKLMRRNQTGYINLFDEQLMVRPMADEGLTHIHQKTKQTIYNVRAPENTTHHV